MLARPDGLPGIKFASQIQPLNCGFFASKKRAGNPATDYPDPHYTEPVCQIQPKNQPHAPESFAWAKQSSFSGFPFQAGRCRQSASRFQRRYGLRRKCSGGRRDERIHQPKRRASFRSGSIRGSNRHIRPRGFHRASVVERGSQPDHFRSSYGSPGSLGYWCPSPSCRTGEESWPVIG